MRRFVSTGAMALFFSFSMLLSFTSSAQLTENCSNLNPVAKGCVGECGISTMVSYDFGPICQAYVRNLCVINEGSNLCPSHDAIAYVLINGWLAASGNITNPGSSVSFTANCGDNIQVFVVAQQNIAGSLCKRLGNLGFTLRSS